MNLLEEMSEILQPYAGVIAKTATLLKISQMLSPLVIFNNMRKAKSTMGMPFFPMLLGLVLTSLGIRFSQIINDDATFNSSVIGLAIMLVYSSIYLNYVPTTEKFSIYVKICGALVFTTLILIYSKLEDSKLIGTRFGFILTCLHYLMYFAPFHGIIKAVKLKCTKFLPLPMIVTGTLVGFSWLLHGIIVKSVFIIAQNLFIQVINVIQLSLFIIYPSEPLVTLSKGEKKKD